MKTLEIFSVKGLLFILFYLLTLIQKCVSISYTIGSYPDHSKYGVNHPECGVAQMDLVYYEIYYTDRWCFRNKYLPLFVLVKNEDIFQELKPKGRISGGIVTKYTEAPWAVNIYYGGDDTICDGVLITLEWVLTMARCNPKNETNRQIYAGSRVVKSGVENTPVLWLPARKWRREKIHYDLAMVKLEKPYRRTFVKDKYTLNTVCLPKRDSVNPKPENASFYSWGEIAEKRTRPTYLRKADIVLRAANACGHKHIICADFVKGSDSPRPCYGDRGAGLVQYDAEGVKAVLAGIFLFTEANLTAVQYHHQPCNKDITYSEFYRVSDVIDWILETITKYNSTLLNE